MGSAISFSFVLSSAYLLSFRSLYSSSWLCAFSNTSRPHSSYFVAKCAEIVAVVYSGKVPFCTRSKMADLPTASSPQIMILKLSLAMI